MTESKTLAPSIGNPTTVLETEQQRLTHVETKIANTSESDEFEYFIQTLEDDSYYPGLNDYLKPDFNKDYLLMLTKDNRLIWGLGKKNAKKGLHHRELRIAERITMADVGAITFLGTDKTFGVCILDEAYLDPLINYWARSFKAENPRLGIHYPSGEQSEIKLREYIELRKTGQKIPRNYPRDN